MARLQYQCEECNSLYDTPEEADACASDYPLPVGTKYVVLNDNVDKGIIEVTRLGKGCSSTVYVKPATGFRNIVPSYYVPTPSWGSVKQIRIKKNETGWDKKLTPLTRAHLEKGLTYFQSCADYQQKQVERYMRLKRRCERMLKMKEFAE